MQKLLTWALVGLLLTVWLGGCGYRLRTEVSGYERIRWSFDSSVGERLRQFVYSETSQERAGAGLSDRVLHLGDISYRSQAVQFPRNDSIQNTHQLEFRARYELHQGGATLMRGSVREIGYYSESIGRPYAGSSGYEFVQRSLWRRALQSVRNRLHALQEERPHGGDEGRGGPAAPSGQSGQSGLDESAAEASGDDPDGGDGGEVR
ncbi:MAG: hypothetical protein ISN29_05710 [Gammaproteobacteria bacterium AqS3]|nr:hypothetical protein [Gammaproteobacteria bacterium AqS3]